jgi:hypothetical protein
MAKPTPTQEELDRAAQGEHVIVKEPDGSGLENPPTLPEVPPDHPDQGLPGAKRRQMEARPAGGYQTRQVTPGGDK